jgi:hypothetical protein
MNREQIIETMARAACERVYPNCDFAPEGSVWVSTWAREREAFEEQASAALSALEAAGLVVVPVEPTDAMLDAMSDAAYAKRFTNANIKSGEEYLRHTKRPVYAAMIRVAQGGPASDDGIGIRDVLVSRPMIAKKEDKP